MLSTPEAGTDQAAIAAHVEEHIAWLLELERADVLFASGPLLSGPGVGPGSGVTVLRAPDEEAARLIAAGDPFVRAGLRTFGVHRWRLNEGSVSVRVSLGTGTYELTKLKAGTVHIEMSTVDVTRKGQVRDAVRHRGGDLLDCPISGSPGMVGPRLATTFASGDQASIDAVRPVLDAISGPWVYTGAFGTGARMKYIASMLLATHTVAAAEAMVLARRSGLDLELVQRTLDNSIAASAIWKQRGPLMQQRTWQPAPGPIDTLHSILQQIEDSAAAAGLQTPVFTSAKTVFDKAVADGWGELDISSVHDQISGESALSQGASS